MLEALLDSWDRNNRILVNLLGAVPEASVRGALAVTTDSSGVASLSVSHPDSLEAALAAAHVEYVIVIRGLRAATDESTAPSFLLPGSKGLTFAGGGSTRAVELSGQVLVLGGHPLAVMWNGFVTGRHGIGKFRESSAERVAAAFATDLELALR